MEINKKYYDGFWGEPSMTFCRMENDVIAEEFIIWEGYFYYIMQFDMGGKTYAPEIYSPKL